MRDGTPFEFRARNPPLEQEKTPFEQEKTPFEQETHLSSKGYLPIKCKSLQVVGISGQGKAVVSDGG